MATKGPNKKAGEKGTNLRPTIAFTPKRKAEFIGTLARTGRKVASANQVGVSYATICQHMRKDLKFASAMEEALDLYRDSIDEEVGRRGKEGMTEEIWYQGTVVGTKMVYSDQLLLAHAKAHHPAYKDKLDATHTVTATVQLDLEELSDEDRADLRKLLQEKAAK